MDNAIASEYKRTPDDDLDLPELKAGLVIDTDIGQVGLFNRERTIARRSNDISEDNKEIIERGYAAFSAGDVEAVMSLFDDDIEWVQPGESSVSGTFHGKAEVMEHIGRLAEKDLTVNLKALVAEGDTVVAITEVTAGGETGEDADVFTVRNGKTVSARVHGDTALLERVYGKKELAAG